ncbi:hypothetical protein [Ferrimonas marina]|uniref:Uncharacterized protein n=1 Tax=Ferrimonas marina TaxID=299255 RepID=A0A1M5UDN9_9GAMM|nr:hypothetical protein [Ferrimonas marina]SHH60763.1 hypothetical protein SAMN02745129_2506 [Ferrimonas marina]
MSGNGIRYVLLDADNLSVKAIRYRDPTIRFLSFSNNPMLHPAVNGMICGVTSPPVPGGADMMMLYELGRRLASEEISAVHLLTRDRSLAQCVQGACESAGVEFSLYQCLAAAAEGIGLEVPGVDVRQAILSKVPSVGYGAPELLLMKSLGLSDHGRLEEQLKALRRSGKVRLAPSGNWLRAPDHLEQPYQGVYDRVVRAGKSGITASAMNDLFSGCNVDSGQCMAMMAVAGLIRRHAKFKRRWIQDRACAI